MSGRWMTGLMTVCMLGTSSCTWAVLALEELSSDAPPVPTVGALPRLVREPTLSVTGRKAPGTQVLLQTAVMDAAAEVKAEAEAESWTYDLALVEGTNTFVVFARTAAGAFSALSEPVTVVLDSTAPVAPTAEYEPIVELAESGSVVSLSLSGTKDPAASLLLDGETIVDREGSASTWSATVEVELGENVFRLSSVDVAGNESAEVVVTITAILDETAPAIPTLDAYDTELGLAEDESTRVVALTGAKDPDASLLLDGVEVVPVDGAPDFDLEVEVRPGPNEWSLSSRDEAGNESEAALVSIYGVQSLAPPSLSDYPAASALREVTLQGTKPPGAGLRLRRAEEETGEALALDAADLPETTFAVTVTLWSEDDGDNTFYLSSVNAFGDAGDESGPYTVQLDTVPPASPTVEPVPPQYLPVDEATLEIVIGGEKEAGSTVVIEGTFDEGVPADIAGTTWTATVSLPLGSWAPSIRARDAAGNLSPAVAGFEIEVLPGLGLPTYSNFPSKPVKDAVLTVRGTRPVGTPAHVELSLDAGVTWEEKTPQDFGGWSFSLILNDDGPPSTDTTFWLRLRDDDGGLSNAVGPFVVTHDPYAPSPPNIAPLPVVSSAALATVDGQKSESRVQIYLRQNNEPCTPGGTPDCAAVVALTAPVSFAVTVALTQGRNDLCFGALDEAGNASAEETCVSTTLGGPPSVRFVQPAPGAAVGPTDEGNPSVAVVLDVTDESADVETVEVCAVSVVGAASVCAPGVASAGGEGRYEATLELPGTPTNGDGFVLTATATNAVPLEGQAVIDVLYVDTPMVLSDLGIDTSSSKPQIAVGADGRIHVVWEDDCWDQGGCPVGQPTFAGDVFYAAWVDGAWTDPVNVSDVDGENDARDPAIAIDSSGDIHVVWQDDGDIADSDTDRDILHRVINGADGTVSPAAAVSIDDCTGVCPDDRRPRLAAGPAGTVHLVWERGPASDRDVVYAKYEEQAWGPVRVVSSDPASGNSLAPAVAVSPDGTAWVTWRDNGAIQGSGTDFDIYLRAVSSQLGPLTLISDDATNGVSSSPTVAVDSEGVVHVAWADDADILDAGETEAEVYWRSWDPGRPGSQLTEIERVSGGADGNNARYPAIAADPSTGAVVIAWSDEGDPSDPEGSGTDTEIAFSVDYLDDEEGFTPPRRVGARATNDGNSTSPAILVYSQSLYCVWQDESDYAAAGLDEDVFLMIEPL